MTGVAWLIVSVSDDTDDGNDCDSSDDDQYHDIQSPVLMVLPDGNPGCFSSHECGNVTTKMD